MFRPLLTAATLGLAALTTTPAAATGHGCQSVQFPRGAYAHTVYGYPNVHQATCYYLAVRPGQRARVRVQYGPVYLTTTHTNGAHYDVQFTTVNGQLYVYVHSENAGQEQYAIEFVFI